MVLFLSNGDTFATGVMTFSYRPVVEGEQNNRILLKVQVENRQTEAILDTGAPYFILAPRVAHQLGLTSALALDTMRMLIRGMVLEGYLTRLTITLIASVGEELTVSATVFIPDSEAAWGDFPSFIGLAGFLERIRFAIDPTTNQFYFGSL